jgi:hypothetical protein
MALLRIPQPVFNDLVRFVSENYSESLPNSLLIAQAFILKYPGHGRKFGLSAINKAVEDGVKQGLF